MIKRASKYNILNVHYFALLIGTVIGNLSTKCSEYLVRAARAAPACSAARQQHAAGSAAPAAATAAGHTHHMQQVRTSGHAAILTF